MNEVTSQIQQALDELEELFPSFNAAGAMEVWAVLYTEGYMMKLRSMQ
jgi:hypothetical protein